MATNSTPGSCASTIRLTAFTPAPPTPTTRSTAWWVRGTIGCLAGGRSVSGSSRPNLGRTSSPDPPIRRSRPSWKTVSATGSGGVGSGTGSGPGSGSGTGSGVGSGTGSGVGSGTGSGVSETVSSTATSTRFAPFFRAVTLTSSGLTDSSVERKRSARGPSRMLARLRAMGEDLLGKLAIGARGLRLRVVLEHGGPPDRRLGELDRLPDARLEDQLPEVLLEDLHRLLRVDGPRIEHRRQDALDLDARVEVLADHLKRVLELHQAPHREVLAL